MHTKRASKFIILKLRIATEIVYMKRGFPSGPPSTTTMTTGFGMSLHLSWAADPEKAICTMTSKSSGCCASSHGRVCNLPCIMKIDFTEYFKNTNRFSGFCGSENRFFRIV